MAINHKGPQFDPNVSLLQNYAQDQETWQQLAAGNLAAISSSLANAYAAAL